MKAGVDDIGSGTHSGFGCVILADEPAHDLEERGRRLLRDAGLPEFHGKEFVASQESVYRAFLEAVREAAQIRPGYAAFNLCHRSFWGDMNEFVRRLSEGALSNLMREVPDFIRQKLPALLSLARDLEEVSQSGTIVDVSIDRAHPSDATSAREVRGLTTEQGAVFESASDTLVRLVNARKRVLFPRGPEIRSIRISESIIVQAADVVANFGHAFVKRAMRRGETQSSRREQIRADIFAEVFEADPVPSDWPLSVSANEIQGPVDANLRMRLLPDERIANP